ncbi:MAG TPA: LPS export ABC transporter permease LptG [Sphingomonadaceae bacterium]|nr:LPS export ABC transporter permease LptG [Sphingomonadaceae bacterium]
MLALIFPSRRVAFYTARMFLMRSLAVLAALVVILQTLDLLGESGRILAAPGNADAELWRYVSLRVPQLVARFLPFSVLLGTLITFATLSQHSEVVAMKASGISAHQILTPLIVAAGLVAALSFVFNEVVVTRATATLSAWEGADYGRVPPGRAGATNVWVRSGDDLVRARTVTGSGANTRLRGVTVYERQAGTLRAIVSADAAQPEGVGWRLFNVRRFNVTAGAVTRQDAAVLRAPLTPDQFTLVAVDADEQRFGTLRRSLSALRAADRPTNALETGMWHKISGPLSSMLMPLLAAVAAFGLARTGQLFLRAVIGMGLGFTYFVADNFALAMGDLGAYPPLLAAWAPFFLFLLIGETVLIRTEE